jgi:hypothetical protein
MTDQRGVDDQERRLRDQRTEGGDCEPQDLSIEGGARGSALRLRVDPS